MLPELSSEDVVSEEMPPDIFYGEWMHEVHKTFPLKMGCAQKHSYTIFLEQQCVKKCLQTFSFKKNVK